jgi:hypothetical protein
MLTGYSGALIANGNFQQRPPHPRVELGCQLLRQLPPPGQVIANSFGTNASGGSTYLCIRRSPEETVNLSQGRSKVQSGAQYGHVGSAWLTKIAPPIACPRPPPARAFLGSPQ